MMHSPASKDAHLFVPVERGVLHASLHVDPRNVCCTPARGGGATNAPRGEKKKRDFHSGDKHTKKNSVIKERSARAVQAALAAVLHAQGLLDVLDVVGVELEAK